MSTTADVSLSNVTRIPVTGPAPFNTLVAVTAWSPVDFADHWKVAHDDTVYYYSDVQIATPLTLLGFDPRNGAPPFQHSTTAALISTGPSTDDHFLFAVDKIDGAGFDALDGTFFVRISTAIQLPDNFIPQGTEILGGFLTATYLMISSYVLVYEPPKSSG